MALVLGRFLNMPAFGGRTYPIGSAAAVVIIGIWIKASVDKHFEELKEQMKQSGKSRDEEKEDR